MRKNLTWLLLLFSIGVMPIMGNAQSIGINTDGSNPDPSSALDIKSSDKGVLIPRLTATQRSGINNPTKGLLVFQADPVPAFCYYNGISWINLSTGDQMNNNGYSINYGLVSTFAGGGDPANPPDGVGTSAVFGYPLGLASDNKGNLYETEYVRNSVRKITPSGMVSTLAGSALTGGYVDATGANARFIRPQGIVADQAGNIYVAELVHMIRMITPSGVVTTIAGHPTQAGETDGAGLAARFRAPYAITIDAAGNLYVADYGNNLIRKIDPARNVTTLGGIPDVTGLVNTADNTGYTLFNKPAGIAVDNAGNIYISDQENHVIRKITSSGIISTFAGTGTAGNADGPLATAQFNKPEGIVVDPSGNVYVADRGNNTIRKITPAGIVSTIAGTGTPGYMDGSDISASFQAPAGLALDAQGNLYVADLYNTRIRKISLH